MNEILLAGVSGFAGQLAALLAVAIQKMKSPKDKKPKKSNFSFRLDEELRAQLEAAARMSDEEDTSAVVRSCIRAFVKAVERDGEITKPYAIISESKLRKLQTAAGKGEAVAEGRKGLPLADAGGRSSHSTEKRTLTHLLNEEPGEENSEE